MKHAVIYIPKQANIKRGEPAQCICWEKPRVKVMSEYVSVLFCVQDDSEDSDTDGEEDEDTSHTSTNTQPAAFFHRYSSDQHSLVWQAHCLTLHYTLRIGFIQSEFCISAIKNTFKTRVF